MVISSARRGLAIYFSLVLIGSAVLETLILQRGDTIDNHPLLIAALMYVPALSSVVARLALRQGFADVSFRLGGREGLRCAAIAWIYPIIVGFLSYGAAWTLGLASFQRPLPASSHIYSDSAIANLLSSFLITATIGTAFSCLTAVGEEVGWRGYMVTRLIDARVPRPLLVGGLIWAGWHVPLIVSGQYAAGDNPAISAALFVVGVVAESYLTAYLRLRSGSVWPAVVMHGSWNAIIQGTFDRATVGTPAAVGESGWLTAVFSLAVIVAVTRGVWVLQRRPGEIFTAPGGRPASLLTM